MSFKASFITLIAILLSIFVGLYHYSSGNEGRKFSLVLKFSNESGRVVPQAEYRVKLPLSVVSSRDVELEDVGQYQKLSRVDFYNVGVDDTQHFTFEGEILDFEHSLSTTYFKCPEILNDQECSLMLSNAGTRQKILELYNKYESEIIASGLTEYQWINLLKVYSQFNKKTDDISSYRVSLAIRANSGAYESNIVLEEKNDNGSWNLIIPEEITEELLIAQVIEVFDGSLLSLSLIEGYGLRLVSAEMDVARVIME